MARSGRRQHAARRRGPGGGSRLSRRRPSGRRGDQRDRRELEPDRRASGRLSDRAAQIAAIAATITKISGQTNLLALNATIEAARAGEAGRGFAVVAAELKALSLQTASASQDIPALLADLGTDITAIGEATRANLSTVSQGRQTITTVTGQADIVAERIQASFRTPSRRSPR